MVERKENRAFNLAVKILKISIVSFLFSFTVIVTLPEIYVDTVGFATFFISVVSFIISMTLFAASLTNKNPQVIERKQNESVSIADLNAELVKIANDIECDEANKKDLETKLADLKENLERNKNERAELFNNYKREYCNKEILIDKLNDTITFGSVTRKFDDIYFSSTVRCRETKDDVYFVYYIKIHDRLNFVSPVYIPDRVFYSSDSCDNTIEAMENLINLRLFRNEERRAELIEKERKLNNEFEELNNSVQENRNSLNELDKLLKLNRRAMKLTERKLMREIKRQGK